MPLDYDPRVATPVSSVDTNAKFLVMIDNNWAMATKAALAGSIWRSGSGAPSNGLGVTGDYYLNIVNGDVYLKGASVYTVQANMKGATGDTGPAGPATTNASLLASGTVADARLSSNVALKNANNSFSVGQTVTGTVQATTLTATGNIFGAGLGVDNGTVRETLDIGGDQTNGLLNIKNDAGTTTLSLLTNGYMTGVGVEVTDEIMCGSIIVNGQINSDNGLLVSDGSGLLTVASLTSTGIITTQGGLGVAGSSTLDNGSITTDGLGVITATGYAGPISGLTNDSGYLTAVNYGVATDMTGGMVQVSGGTIVNDIDVYSDGAGNLTVTNGITAASANFGSSVILLNSDGSVGLGGEVVMTSVVKMTGLPTSDPSVPGQLWLDTTNGNVLKVSV